MDDNKVKIGSRRGRLLAHLEKSGRLSLTQVGEAMKRHGGVRVARADLDDMVASGLVVRGKRVRPIGAGRPATLFLITEKGRAVLAERLEPDGSIVVKA